MSSFLSAIQKASIDSSLDRLHDTFGKEIYVYIEKHKDSSAETTFNALYEAPSIKPSASFSTILTRHPIFARVRYVSEQPEDLMQAKIPNSRGKARIKVTPEDYEKIKICTKIEIENSMYIVDGDPAIEGIFSNNYYTIYLKREN